jgi:hypothetical protein
MFRHKACQEVEPVLWNYVAGRTTEAEYEAVEAHLNVCAACRRQAEEYRVTVALTSAFRDADVPETEATWGDLRAMLEAKAAPTPVRASRPRWTLPVWSGAALAATAVALFVLWPRPAPDRAAVPGPAQGPLVAQEPMREKISAPPTKAVPSQANVMGRTKQLAATDLTPGPTSERQGEKGVREGEGDRKRRLHSASVAVNDGVRPPKQKVRPPKRTLPAPETPMIAEEPRPQVAKRNYAVDGERPASAELSNHFVAYAVPSGPKPSAPRTFVMDSIPVTASATRPVSAQSKEQELQAW